MEIVLKERWQAILESGDIMTPSKGNAERTDQQVPLRSTGERYVLQY